MSVTRADFASAWHALETKSRSLKDVRSALTLHQAAVDRGERSTLPEILGIAAPPSIDASLSGESLDALGTLLIELEILTEPEVEKIARSFIRRPDRKALPPVPLPDAIPGIEVQWEIGRGRSSAVFRARRNQPPHDAALKVFRAGGAPDPGRIPAPQIQAPGLLRTFETGPGYIVTEFHEGAALESMLEARQLTLRRGLELLGKAARILAPIHAGGAAHGSLRPSVLLIGPDDSVRIADFGLRTGTPSDDVFALGRMGYEIATGVPPYCGFRSRELRTPSMTNPDAAGTVDRILSRALEKEPSKRYPHAGALADDIDRYLRHEELPADPVARPAGSPFRKPMKTRKVVGLLTGLVLSAAVLWVVGTRTPSDPVLASTTATPVPVERLAGQATPAPSRTSRPAPTADPVREELARKGPIGRTEERDLRNVAAQALAAGHFDRLIQLGEEFLARGADREYAYYWMAVGHRGTQDAGKALIAIDGAIQRAPENRDYVEFRLPLLLARAEFPRALGDIETVYGRNSAGINAAIRSLTQDLRVEPSPASLIHRGALLHYKRNYPQAAADFVAAAKGGDSRAWYFAAIALSADDRRAEALEAVRAFLAAHGSLPVAADARALQGELERP